jgi:hypothetical protein
MKRLRQKRFLNGVVLVKNHGLASIRSPLLVLQLRKDFFSPMVANRMCIIQPRKLDTLSISFDETFLY